MIEVRDGPAENANRQTYGPADRQTGLLCLTSQFSEM